MYNSNHLLLTDLLFSTTIYCDNILEESKFSAKEGNLMTNNKKLVGAIIAVGVLSFLGIVIETALNIAFPQLMKQFAVSAKTVQWLTTGYMLVSTIIIPFGSFLRKRYRAIALFRVAVISFLIGTIMAGFTSSFTMLLSGRLLQGIADGIGLPLMFSLILEQAPKEKVGTLMGIGTLVIAFAPAVGPAYGGLILNYLPWQVLFILIIPIIIITWLLGERSIVQVKKPVHVPFDFQGGAFLSVFLVSTLWLLLDLTDQQFGLRQIVLLLVALISCLVFVYCEQKSDHAVIKLALFKSARFDGLLIAFFLLQLISLCLSFLLPNVLQTAFAQTTANTSLLILPAAITDAIVAALAGIIYDKTNPRLPIILGVIIICFSFLIASFNGSSVSIIVISYVVFMIGLGLSYSNIMTFSLARLENEESNDGNVIFMTAQSYSGAMGTAMAASLLTWGQAQSKNIVYGTLASLKLSFEVLLLISVIVAVLCIVSLIEVKRK